jgi:tripartite motif-containing protein 71
MRSRAPRRLVVAVAVSAAAGAAALLPPTTASAALAPRPAFTIADPRGVAPLYPAGGDVAPDGTMYVADSGRSRIVVITDRGRQRVVSPARAGWNDPRDLEVDVRRPRVLWVANTSAEQVVKLDRDGTVLERFGGFAQLYGIANDRRGVYVADTYANRVVKISKRSGAERWSTAACFGDGFGRPRDVAVGSNGDIYVADTDNDRIVRLSAAGGACVDGFGTAGAAPGQLNAPRALTSDGRGGLWIAEGGNDRIQHFRNGGAFVGGSDVGGFGNGRGEFRSAHCVFMDGRVVSVCDTFNFRIQRFRVRDGEPVFDSIVGGRPPAKDGFNGPFDVAFGGGGSIYVADWFNHRIQRFTANGEVVWARGRYGTPPGSFIFPRGVVVDGSTLVVTDSENNRIDLLDASDGSFQQMIRPDGTNFLRPHQTAVTSGGTYWVADTGNVRLLHVQKSGTVLGSSQGWPDGDELTGPPRGVAVDAAGNVYASSGNRVLKFSSGGLLLDVIASGGTDPAQVMQPYGLRIAGSGADAMLLVADRGNHRVLVFELDGTPVARFGSHGSGEGRFVFPQGVDMHETSGRIAVADFGNDRISVWRS